MPSIPGEGCVSGFFIINMMKALHIRSITVCFNELRISQVSLWFCIYVLYEQRNFYKITISLTFCHKFDLNLNYAFSTSKTVLAVKKTLHFYFL